MPSATFAPAPKPTKAKATIPKRPTVTGMDRSSSVRAPLASKSINIPTTPTPSPRSRTTLAKKAPMATSAASKPGRASLGKSPSMATPRRASPLARSTAITPKALSTAPGKVAGRTPSYAQPTKSMAGRTSPPAARSTTKARSSVSRTNSAAKKAASPSLVSASPASASAEALATVSAVKETDPVKADVFESKPIPPAPVEIPEECLSVQAEKAAIIVEMVEEKEVKVEEAKVITVKNAEKKTLYISMQAKEGEKIEKEMKKTQYPIIHAKQEEKITSSVVNSVKKKLEEKIIQGLRLWSSDATVEESMVVTELVQTTHGVRRMRRYIIEEEKPSVVVRPKRWSVTAREIMESLRKTGC